MKRLWLIFILICGTVYGKPLSLAELIDTALKNNPETAKAWGAVKHAQAALGLAQSANYPSLDAQGTFMHGREVKFPNGPDTIFTDYGGELSLSYLLFDFGERSASIQAMKESLKAANWGADFTLQQVIFKVCSTYYEYLSAVDLLKEKESTLKDYQTILEAAEELHKAGLRSLSDLSMSKAEIAQVQMEVAQQRASVAVTYGQLLTALGMPVELKIEVETNPDGVIRPVFSEKMEDLIAFANSRRADLMAKRARLAEMEQDVKRAKRAPLPKLNLVGQTGWLQYAKHKGSGYNYNAGVTLGFPIFKGFEYTYRKRLALANVEITTAELRELQEDVALEVLSFSELVKAACDMLKWSDEYLEESTKTYEGTLDRYKAGLQNIFDLIQTQRILADARIKRTQAKTQWLVSLAQLAFATGTIR
jgi:outer membrane protein TolC